MRTLTLVSVAVAVMFVSHANSQPVSCKDDAQCSLNYFCGTALHTCQKCLGCEDLKREAPILASPTCIKSVVECGSCLQGLMVDHRGDEYAECVPQDEPAVESSLPVYIWLIIGFVILGFFVMITTIIYVLRRKDLFRISTATWLRSSCTSTNVNASAPEPPPPYNPYQAVRPESPIVMPNVAYSPTEEEISHPFIKRAPGLPPQAAREAAGSQNARVYNPPAYVRVNPLSPASPLNEEEDSNNWPPIHNEDTTPHDWMPNTSTNNEDNSGSTLVNEAAANPETTVSEATVSDLPAMLAAARDTTLVAPPAKKQRTQHDGNNNGGTTSNDISAPSIYFNIVQIHKTKL